ncbi:MAG: UPF0182 family protein, partial [Actinomycetota bacterium]|nr:UPF0182 family protein [Actinomycetota bacterium]
MGVLAEVRRRWWLVLIGAAVVVFLFGSRAATFYTDVLWFREVGFDNVFWGLLWAQVALGLLAGLAMTALLGTNLLVAKRLSPTYRIPSPQEEVVERYRDAVEPYARPLLLGVSVAVGVLSGLSLVGEWPTYLLWANAVEFGQDDPQFGRDLGWFVFVLPFHRLVNSWLFTALALTIVLAAVVYYLFGGIRPQSPGQKITPQANVHLSGLLAALVAVRAWGFVLDRYMLSYSERGTVTGLSYTDVHAQLRAYEFLAVIAVVCVGLFLVNIRIRGWLLPSAGVGILLVAALVLSGVYPAVVQRLRVEPQELPREAPYIQRNIDGTRFAYGLDAVEFQEFPAEAELSATEISDHRGTLESIRLWDPAKLQATYQQLQAFRPYYDFLDVDVDRYPIEGDQSQVMLGVREVDERSIPAQAQTWQNRRMVYTHGYGIVSSSVSGATPQGLPLFLANNIPIQAEEALEPANPRIYFGENPPSYSIVNGADVDELDFPLEGSRFATNRYEGEAGVGVGSPLRRLAFALRFGDPNIVLSSLIRSDSQVLYNRQVSDRVRLVAPFLKLDHDPYPVVVDGRIKWIVDAYTVSDMLPYSQRVELGELTRVDQVVLQPQQENGQIVLRETIRQLPSIEGRANYIRNSVKAVVDAVDGTVTLYVTDPNDPLIQAWARAFPGSFTDLDEASDELRAHFRYPEDLLRVQAGLYRAYHMREAAEFYAREDAWQIPPDASFLANRGDQATADEQSRSLRPYYLLMRLPGEQDEEFALIQPFIPSGEQRNNLIGYLAGRSDPEVYGQLKAYVFPPNRTVFGPQQVQSRIDQDSDVSQQITLWNASGSTVIRGNLLVIPVADSLLYVEPLFLQSRDPPIPELKKVVAVFGDRVE